jgi:hypothetical protein
MRAFREGCSDRFEQQADPAFRRLEVSDAALQFFRFPFPEMTRLAAEPTALFAFELDNDARKGFRPSDRARDRGASARVDAAVRFWMIISTPEPVNFTGSISF